VAFRERRNFCASVFCALSIFEEISRMDLASGRRVHRER
jgi:hypothetical protein